MGPSAGRNRQADAEKASGAAVGTGENGVGLREEHCCTLPCVYYRKAWGTLCCEPAPVFCDDPGGWEAGPGGDTRGRRRTHTHS